MKVTRSHTTPQFEGDFLALSTVILPKTKRKIKLFEEDCFHRSLETHKLRGVLKNFWAFSVDKTYRVIFRFLSHGEVMYYRVGTHKVYEELERLF